jgi:hypothetical protein
MLQKTPRHVLARRERSRRSRARRRKGLRVYQIELADEVMEGIIDALTHFGRLREGEIDQRRIAEELARQLVWWSEHWRELRR